MFHAVIDLCDRRRQRVLALLYRLAQVSLDLDQTGRQFCFGLLGSLAKALQLSFEGRAQIMEARDFGMLGKLALGVQLAGVAAGLQ